MATVHLPTSGKRSDPEDLISYENALEVLSRDEAFKATISAMNTLLIAKGIYSADEFAYQFRQAAARQLRKRDA